MKRFVDLFKKSSKLEKALEILKQCAKDGSIEAEKMVNLYQLLQAKEQISPISEQLNHLKNSSDVLQACQKIFLKGVKKAKASSKKTSKKRQTLKRARNPKKDSK